LSALRVNGLSAGYGSQLVLTDATLVAPSGSLTCVLGPSGCGKTTMLRVIAGFEPARAGSIEIGDRVVDDGNRRVAPERRRVGYVAQDGALFPHLKVADNIGFALPRTTRHDRLARRESVDEMLRLVDMTDLADRFPHELSGGQQQRVAVARALASKPDIVLLDEPFASLDASLRARLRQDIREVLRAAEVTTVLVTHDRSEALSLADQVAVIRDGRIVQTGAPRDVYTKPADVGVATFVGDANLLDATITDGLAKTALGTIPVDPACRLANGPARVVVRPEQILLGPGVEDVPGSVATATTGRVTRVEYYGHEARIETEVDDGPNRVRIVTRMVGEVAPTEGSLVAVTVATAVWALP
jgi:iron(III) transport system ATP-binding protein